MYLGPLSRPKIHPLRSERQHLRGLFTQPRRETVRKVSDIPETGSHETLRCLVRPRFRPIRRPNPRSESRSSPFSDSLYPKSGAYTFQSLRIPHFSCARTAEVGIFGCQRASAENYSFGVADLINIVSSRGFPRQEVLRRCKDDPYDPGAPPSVPFSTPGHM
jgi:hypothetical protein